MNREEDMGFNWEVFLNSHHIEFQSSGPHTAKGNIVITCPWCGSDDPSMHLSISTDGLGYRCFRRPETHKGKKAARLIQALLKCSYERALDIAGERPSISGSFMSDLQHLMVNYESRRVQKQLKLPPEFRPCFASHSFNPYERYLLNRNISPIEAYEAIRYCTHGPYHHRIIFPVHFEDKLVGWTGRTIGNAQPRYKTLSHKLEKAELEGYSPALGPITDYLLFYDEALRSGGDTIYLCEGPFDSLNLRMLGERDHGVTSVAFFGQNMTTMQITLLSDLLCNFRRKFLLLDQNTLAQSIIGARALSHLGVRIKVLPFGIKDPACLRSLELLNGPSCYI